MHCAFISSVFGFFFSFAAAGFLSEMVLLLMWTDITTQHNIYLSLSHSVECSVMHMSKYETWANVVLCAPRPVLYGYRAQQTACIRTARYVYSVRVREQERPAGSCGVLNARISLQPKYYENISSLAINDVVVAHCHWMRHFEYLVRLELPQTWNMIWWIWKQYIFMFFPLFILMEWLFVNLSFSYR